MSCINKESFLEGFAKFSDDVKEHHSELTASDWQNVDKEYKGYLEKCYPKFKEKMTSGENVDFWKDALSYGFYRSANDEDYEFDLSDYGVDVEEEIDLLTTAGKEEVEKFLKEEFGPQLESTIDAVLKEFENIGEQIKNWLDEI